MNSHNHRFFAMVIFIVLGTSTAFSQSRALFRFDPNLPLGHPNHDPVTLVDIEIMDQIEAEEEVARGAGGWDLRAPKSAHFYSDSSSMISEESAVMSYFGNHEISGDVWINPESEDGTIFTWGDSLAPHFITLFLENGQLNIHRYYVDSLFSMVSNVEIDTGSWHHISWINRIADGYVEFDVYVNGVNLVHDSEFLASFPPAFTVLNSPVTLGLSADPRSYGPSFQGRIMGVSLNSFTRSEQYLTSFSSFDGSEYYGDPLYIERGYDKALTSSPTPVSRTAFVPYSNDYYIPQGLASTYEDKRDPVDEHMVYLSMYHKDIDGEINGNNSIIVEMDPENNYRVRRCFRLTSGPVYGHVPSMAYCAGYLFLGSENVVYKCQLPEYDPVDGKYFDLDPIENYSMLSSNLDFFEDTLWVASWGRYNSTDRSFLLGYPIDTDGDIDLQASYARYEIPNTNQGAGWTTYGGERYLFVHTSYGGTNNSKIYRFRHDQLRPTFLPEADTIFYLPAGGEDLSFNNEGDMITVSESSSRAYQLRTYSSPWQQFFPFVYEITPEVLFGDVDTTTTGLAPDHGPQIPDGFSAMTYPNPFNDTIQISYNLETDMPMGVRIFDLRGRVVETLVEESSHTSGRHQMSWMLGNNPSGVYLVSFFSNGRDFSTKRIVAIK